MTIRALRCDRSCIIGSARKRPGRPRCALQKATFNSESPTDTSMPQEMRAHIESTFLSQQHCSYVHFYTSQQQCLVLSLRAKRRREQTPCPSRTNALSIRTLRSMRPTSSGRTILLSKQSYMDRGLRRQGRRRNQSGKSLVLVSEALRRDFIDKSSALYLEQSRQTIEPFTRR